MHTNDIYLLPDDRAYAEKRILELEDEIQALGPDFNDAFSQSSETWHDNSPFEAVRDKQSMLAAELHKLRTLVRTASLVPPKVKKGTVGVGSTVVLGNDQSFLIAGEWTYRAGEKVDGKTVVSIGTPIAKELYGKKVGEPVKFGKIDTRVERIASA